MQLRAPKSVTTLFFNLKQTISAVCNINRYVNLLKALPEALKPKHCNLKHRPSSILLNSNAEREVMTAIFFSVNVDFNSVITHLDEYTRLKRLWRNFWLIVSSLKQQLKILSLRNMELWLNCLLLFGSNSLWLKISNFIQRWDHNHK